MKKVVLSVIAAVLMILGLTSVATLSPAYASVICSNGVPADKISDCPEWDGTGISENDNCTGSNKSFRCL